MSHKWKLSIFIVCRMIVQMVGRYLFSNAPNRNNFSFTWFLVSFMQKNQICIYFFWDFFFFFFLWISFIKPNRNVFVEWPEAVQTWINIVCLSFTLDAHIEFFESKFWIDDTEKKKKTETETSKEGRKKIDREKLKLENRNKN